MNYCINKKITLLNYPKRYQLVLLSFQLLISIFIVCYVSYKLLIYNNNEWRLQGTSSAILRES